MSCAQFKLDMFEGPLDLLLHLISKHKLNIHDIQISLLLEQYLEYMHQLEHEDLEDAAEFLEMAARLIYIKTVSLLPHDEEAQELKKELEGRLIEYSQCKYLAGILAKGYVGGEIFVRKPEPIPVDKTYTREHDAIILLEAYLGLSEKARNEKPINAKIFQPIVSHRVVSLGTKIVYILKRLYTEGVCDLSHIYDGMESKSERVATFLAILELTKSGRIVLNDDNTQISFSDRTISRKKHRRDKAEQEQESAEDTAEVVGSGETADEKTAEAAGEITAEAGEKAEKTLGEAEQGSAEDNAEENGEGGQESAAVNEEKEQGVPEFDPEGSTELPQERAEAADRYRTESRQATERVAGFRPLVLELPIIDAESVEETADEVEDAERAVEGGAVAELPMIAAEEAEKKAESVEETAALAETVEQAVEGGAEAGLPMIAAEEAEKKAESVEETAVEAVDAERAVEGGAEAGLPIKDAEDAEEAAEAIVKPRFAEADDEDFGIPFKTNYWGSLRYYWGYSPVGDDSQRNCWRYGRV